MNRDSISEALKIDPALLSEGTDPGGVRLSHSLRPVAGYLGVVGGILGAAEGDDLQLEVRVKLGVAQGATLVPSARLLACLSLAQSALGSLLGEPLGSLLALNLSQQAGRVLERSGNAPGAAEGLLGGAPCSCRHCRAKREASEQGIDGIEELTALARRTAAQKASPPAPPLELGSHDLGEGWDLLLERSGSGFLCTLWGEEQRHAGAYSDSLPEAVVSCITEGFRGQVEWPASVAEALSRLGSRAFAQRIREQVPR